MKPNFSILFLWLYRVVFLLTGLVLLNTAYILFAYLTMGDHGFNMHPFLPESNLGIGLAVVFGWPIMVFNAVIHLLCWGHFFFRRNRKKSFSGHSVRPDSSGKTDSRDLGIEDPHQTA